MQKNTRGKKAEIILYDLVDSSPDEEGKWFGAPKSGGLYDEALALAKRSPCDPRTLTRASSDLAEKEPSFAVEIGLVALYWIIAGYGYEITGADVLEAFRLTMKAAAHTGGESEMLNRVKVLTGGNNQNQKFVRDVLEKRLR